MSWSLLLKLYNPITHYTMVCIDRPLSELINAKSHVLIRALIMGLHMTFKFDPLSEYLLCAFNETTVHHPVVSSILSG